MKANVRQFWVTALFLVYGFFVNHAQAQTTINFSVRQAAALQANAGAGSQFCAGDQVTLQGVATGGTGPYTYAWSPASVSNPASAQTTANPSGTTTYSLTITDSKGCIATSDVTFTQIICTSISENTLAGLELYPNPAGKFVTLKLQDVPSAYNIRLTGILGQEVMRKTVPVTGNLHEVISLEGFAKGVYLVQLNSQHGAVTRKLIVE